MASWTEFKKVVYERIEVSSFKKHVKHGEKQPNVFKALNMTFALGREVFNASGRLVSEVGLRSADPEDMGLEAKMLRGLSITGFKGMFTVSYEPFNHEVRFSSVSKSFKELRLMASRLKASILAGYPGAELEELKASRETILWPLGGFPVSTYKNALIVLRDAKVSTVSFLRVKIKDDSLSILENGLNNTLRSSAESGCSLRLCAPLQSCNGILHGLQLWVKKSNISRQYSKAYRELRGEGLFNSRGRLMGFNLGKSTRLETLRYQYERLNGKTGCWKCSPLIVVIGPLARDSKEAYHRQRGSVEAVKASFASSYGIKLEETGWLNIHEVARNILARRILSSKLHLTSEELSCFVNIPQPVMPSLSFTMKRNVEFMFNPLDLKRNGILLGWYKTSAGRLEVRIGVEDLPLHLAVFGVPGSGKTTLVKTLLKRYLLMGGVAMIFDRHGEYVDDFNGATVLDPENMKINLLEHDGHPETYAKVLSEVFSMAWPDEFGPLVSHTFRKTYLRYIRETSRPNLLGFIAYLENCAASDDFMLLRSGKARDKLFSLVGRLSELAEGSMGKVFNGIGKETIGMKRVLLNNVVFDLTGFDTDRDANVFTWLILKKVYDLRKRMPNQGLPHVIVCEEAHNIAPHRFEGQETVVEKMLREMRKFGESVWLIDQRPLSVSRDVLGLCGTIVCLRLQYASDVGKVADTMHLSQEQALKLQELKQGEAVTLLPGMSTAMPIVIKAC